MLPLVNDVLDFATGTFEAISNLDEGTKIYSRFGGVIAVSGPAIKAITGIKNRSYGFKCQPLHACDRRTSNRSCLFNGLAVSKKKRWKI